VLEEAPVLEEGVLEPAEAEAVEEARAAVAEEEEAEPLAADLPSPGPEPEVEAAPPTAREMAAPYDRVEIEEEVPVRRRIDDLAERLKANPRDYPLRLELARLHREEQEWAAALTEYQDLISARKFLPNILDDLELMLKRGVEQARVYQLMGDAYLQENALDKALQMYRLAQQALTKR
jgi:tetratricopeptide (TPR) repeat protein